MDRAHHAYSGIADEDIDATEALHGSLGELFRGALLADVSLQHHEL